MRKKTTLRISEHKLLADLLEIDDDLVKEVEYLQWANEVAEKLEQGIVDAKLIAKVRLAACNDREHLKGDYCIEVAKLRRFLKRKVNRNSEGKKFKATEGLIKSVYRNHKSKELSVKDFCTITGISKNKYYRIIHQDIEDAATIRYLKSIQKQIEKQ